MCSSCDKIEATHAIYLQTHHCRISKDTAEGRKNGTEKKNTRETTVTATRIGPNVQMVGPPFMFVVICNVCMHEHWRKVHKHTYVYTIDCFFFILYHFGFFFLFLLYIHLFRVDEQIGRHSRVSEWIEWNFFVFFWQKKTFWEWQPTKYEW